LGSVSVLVFVWNYQALNSLYPYVVELRSVLGLKGFIFFTIAIEFLMTAIFFGPKV
jgi:hypothetical protein